MSRYSSLRPVIVTILLLFVIFGLTTIAGCGGNAPSEASVSPVVNSEASSQPREKITNECIALESSSGVNGNYGGRQTIPAGKQKWVFEKTTFDQGYYDNRQLSQITIAAGLIFFSKGGKESNDVDGNKDGTLFALDPKTGQEKLTIPFELGNIVAANGSIIGSLLSEANTFVAIDPKTGQSKCEEQVTGELPIASDGYLYKVLYQQEKGILATNEETGESWKWTFDFLPEEVSGPVIAGGSVILSGTRQDELGTFCTLFALDAKTGEVMWSWKAENRSSATEPIINGDTVYIAAEEDYEFKDPDKPTMEKCVLYSLDAATGKEKWNTRTNYFSCQPLSADNDSVYMTGAMAYAIFGNSSEKKARVIAFDAEDGNQTWAWTSENESDHVSSPAIIPGLILINASFYSFEDDSVIAIYTSSGKEKWQFKSSKTSFIGSPLFFDGMVYVKSEDGKIYAIE